MNRIKPRLPASAMQTYQILAPTPSHFRAATCAEVECPAYLRGWTTTLDLSTDLGQAQQNYIVRQSGRKFSVIRTGPNGCMAEFTFEPGQRCFKSADHRLRLFDKPELYIVRDGDWRNRTGGHRQFTGHHAAEDWKDHFANHQDQLAEVLRRG
jgi:hypothetical protein